MFYVGLQPFHTDAYRTGLYVIGYFTVKDVVAFDDLSHVEAQRYSKHIIHSDAKSSDARGFVLIVGDEEHSKLLGTAVPLANPVVNRDKGARAAFVPSDEMIELIGLPGTIDNNAPPIWVVGHEYVKNLKRILGL